MHAHYILKGIGECSESDPPFRETSTLSCGYMRSKPDSLAINTSCLEALLQPLELVTWVGMELEELKVLVIAGLRIDADEASVGEDAHLHLIVACFLELLKRCIIKPVHPGCSYSHIQRVLLILSVVHVHRNRLVVTEDRECRDIFEVALEQICELLRVPDTLLCCLCPDIVLDIVSSPHDAG